MTQKNSLGVELKSALESQGWRIITDHDGWDRDLEIDELSFFVGMVASILKKFENRKNNLDK